MENNVQGQLIITFLYPFFLTACLLQIAPVHFGTSSSPGASVYPITRQESLNTFDSAAPRTYSTICISSESCLRSIVGLALLPCFGTLCSVISAKVAQGELLRLCPGSSGRAPQ